MADLVVTETGVVIYDGAEIVHGRAGETLLAGQAVFQHTDGKLWKAACSAAADARAVGITLNGGAADQTVAYIKKGGVNPGATVVVGTVYGVTDTAGGIGDITERAAEDYITILGVGLTASRIDVALNKSEVMIPAL